MIISIDQKLLLCYYKFIEEIHRFTMNVILKGDIAYE